MGLDSFKTESSSNRGTSSGSGGSSRGSKADHDDSHNAFKIIWNGKRTIPISDNEIVISTESEWEDIVDFITDEVGMSMETFYSKSNERRFEIVDNAVEVIQHDETEPYGKNEECMVCGEKFMFPEDWDFVEFDDFICCPNHTIDDVMKEYNEDKKKV